MSFFLICVILVITARSGFAQGNELELNLEKSCEPYCLPLEMIDAPNQPATLLNSHEFGKAVLATQAVKMMREAGVLSCRVEGRVAVDQAGDYICHQFTRSCFIYWDMAVSDCMPLLRFQPAFHQGQHVASWVYFEYFWICEW
jgi:hypothetical protein